MESLLTMVMNSTGVFGSFLKGITIAFLAMMGLAFVAGAWTTICAMRHKMHRIKSFSLIPFRIEFEDMTMIEKKEN